MASRTTPLARFGVLVLQPALGAGDQAPQALIVGSVAWYLWLEEARVFAFEDDTGSFTARKERFKRGGWYWKAYRRQWGRLRRAYLGKSDQLTWDTLQGAARRLAGTPAPHQARAPETPGPAPWDPAEALAPESEMDAPTEVRREGHDARAASVQRRIWGARLVQSKLACPRLPEDLVPRERLTEALQRLAEQPLTAIVGPAGYGKTTLLTEWVAAVKPRLGWLTLDAEDNDPVRFWLHVAVALERALGDAPHASALLEQVGADALDAAQAMLVERVNQRPIGQDVREDEQGERVYLALDDYHEMENDAIHERFCAFIERAQLASIILTSRSDLPPVFSRLLARGHANALPEGALRFTDVESAAFLSGHGGADLSGATATLLRERLEGWPTGWRFAALMLETARGEAPTDADSLLRTLARGESHLLTDYLHAEILRRLSERERDFLLATSILDRLCAPLCDAVTGGNDAQALLQRLERLRLFITPLGPLGPATPGSVPDSGMGQAWEQSWYRYHPLLASALRAQSRARDAAAQASAHERAARWYEAQGEVEEAMRHALRASEPTLAISMIDAYGAGFLKRGETTTVLGWMDALPAGVARRWPRVLLLRAQALLVMGQVEAAEALVAEAERTVPEDAQPLSQNDSREETAVIAHAEAHAMRATIAATRGDYAQASAGYHLALALMSARETSARAAITSDLASVLALMGQPEAAITAYRSAASGLSATGDLAGMLDILWPMGTLLMTQAELPAAARVFQRAIHLGEEASVGPLPTASGAYHYLSRILYEWDQCEEALPLLETSLRLNAINGDVGLETRSQLLLGKLRLAAGDAAGVRACMERVERIERTPGMRPGVARTAGAVSAHLACLLGDVNPTAAWAHELGLEEPLGFEAADDFTRLTYVRLLLAEGNPATAAGLLERARADAAAARRVDLLIESEMLLALAEQTRGRQERALEALESALRHAATGRYVRLLLDTGEPMLALITRLSRIKAMAPRTAGQVGMARDTGQDGRLVAYLRDLTLAACRMEARAWERQPERSQNAGARQGMLTQREIEVVRRIAAGLSNAQIARELVVESSTIKWHAHNIIQKLGARTRAGAIARAYQLGLL